MIQFPMPTIASLSNQVCMIVGCTFAELLLSASSIYDLLHLPTA